MGRKCCVPGCKSNYDGQAYTPCFSFPKYPVRRAKWLHNIHGKDFSPCNTAVVCVKHFSENFVIREDRMKRDDGSELVVPRKHLALKNDAYPTIFEGQPSYLSSEPSQPRRRPEDRVAEARLAEERKFRQWCEEDTIKSFACLQNGYKMRLTSGWLVLNESDCLILGKMCFVDYPKIILSVKFFDDLSVSVWHNNVRLPKMKLDLVLGKSSLCDRWTKFESLLSHLYSYELNDASTKIEMALQLLISSVEEFSDKNSNLKFCIEQLQLLNSKKPKYSSPFLVWCCTVYFCYPAAYNFICQSKVILLPSVSYMRQLGSNLGVGKVGKNNAHVSYLSEKFKVLDASEHLISIMLDEIYVKPGLSYVGGKVLGKASNNQGEATTLQCFTLSSVLSKNKDVIAVYPVKKLTAHHLKELVTEVLQIVGKIGYRIVSLISDNNRVNRTMFQMLCGGTLGTKFVNPMDKDHKVFIVFDTVHLLKSIRNNWLNQWKTNQTFYVPSFNDATQLLKPTVQHLKMIYNKELGKNIKTAPALSQKVLYPSPLERQNVNAAVKLFDEKNIAALEHFSSEFGDGFLETKSFMEIILCWWKIVNVKHPFKGVHLGETFCHPIHSVDDSSLEFLKKFCLWLDEWHVKESHLGSSCLGKLSNDTYIALRHTSQCLIDISCHLLLNFPAKYVLLGKFQTDQLESRFGQYRSMNGGNYNVGIKQVLETEKKLKIISILKMKSAMLGELPLKTCLVQCSDDVNDEGFPDFFSDILMKEGDTPSEDSMQVMVFIAGYVSKQIKKKINCCECKSVFCIDREMVVEMQCEGYSEYLEFLDRGGLMWPSKFVVDICLITFGVFALLISEEYETKFIDCNNKKNFGKFVDVENGKYVPRYVKCL